MLRRPKYSTTMINHNQAAHTLLMPAEKVLVAVAVSLVPRHEVQIIQLAQESKHVRLQVVHLQRQCSHTKVITNDPGRTKTFSGTSVTTALSRSWGKKQ